MMRISWFIWLLAMLLGGVPAQAQIDPDELPTEAREQFEAFKIAFFTRRLSLSSEEAKRFWPVYDRYTEALSSIRRKQRIKRLEMKDAYDGDSEERLEQLADEYISITTSEADVRQQFHTEFKTVLPIRKVLLLYKAEQDFKRELLEEIRQRRQGRGGRFRH